MFICANYDSEDWHDVVTVTVTPLKCQWLLPIFLKKIAAISIIDQVLPGIYQYPPIQL